MALCGWSVAVCHPDPAERRPLAPDEQEFTGARLVVTVSTYRQNRRQAAAPVQDFP
jgi:hypothetical protein